MRLETQVRKTLFLGAFLGSLIACSHRPTVVEFPDTANARDEVKQLDSDMNTAMGNQVNVLAPENFESAQEALEDAKKNLDKKNDSKYILHRVAEGRAYLLRANEVAQLGHTTMEEVAIARQKAITAGAAQVYSSDFNRADDNLKDVTSDIEDNDLNNAEQNRGNLQAQYLDLELRAIKHANLGQSRQTIDQALQEGAKDYAPRTLALAEKSLKDTDAFIIANRHDNEQIKVRSDQARANADHLLKITRESKASEKISPEEVALQLESEQNKVQEKQALLLQEQDAKKALSAENQNLTSGQTFQKKFEEARAQFDENEAEVYRQGDRLLIRLKGLEFPVAQAALKGSNFPLLAKVQKVIEGFGKSSITVEGHTDSKGGKALNQQLSANRAKAVKEYLESNAGTEEMNVKAVGYGFQKPLASNKTPDGRAQNRRVDVIIQPEDSVL